MSLMVLIVPFLEIERNKYIISEISLVKPVENAPEYTSNCQSGLQTSQSTATKSKPPS